MLTDSTPVIRLDIVALKLNGPMQDISLAISVSDIACLLEHTWSHP